jgi:polar amino acid transport system permease protein
LDTSFIIKFIPLYLQAILLVLKLCFFGALCSLAVGFLCAVVRYCRVPVLRRLCGAYIELSRNTPLLIQLFFLYFGLPKMGLTLSSFTCAVAGLSFLGGSYMAEAFRSGFEAIGKGQIEAGYSIGLSQAQLIFYVVLPQALAVSMSALAANVLFLIKETSVVSIIALSDLMSVAKELIGMYYKTNEALLMLVAGYLVVLLPLSFVFRLAEGRLRFAGFGRPL